MSDSDVDKKLDKLTDSVHNIDVTLASQHEVLVQHIRRTEILEEEIKPLQTHVVMINGALKFVGLLCVICGAIEGIVILLEYVRKVH